MRWVILIKTTFKRLVINKLTTLLFLLICGLLTAYGQPIASFSISDSAGCAPKVVQFTNLSSGTNTDPPQWILGNGNNSSEQDPKATYDDPGTYTVKLIVTDGVDTDTAEHTVVVYQGPQAQFTSITKGCAPTTVKFTDASTPGDAPISSWTWDFQSGETSNIQNPEHTYTIEDTYDVVLIVTDTNGCIGNRNATNYIEIVNPPVAAFTVSPDAVCTVPETISLTSTSSGSGTLTYAWKVNGVGLPGTTNASFDANQFDMYSTELIVSSDFGCSDTLVKNINISEQIAMAYLTQYGDTIQNNDTICAGMVSFANASQGTNQVIWYFGDGSAPTISQSGDHTYTKAQNVSVMFIADPSGKCADTLTWDLYVDVVDVDFTQNIDFSCLSPVTVEFEGISSNAETWEWTFDDGTTSSSQNTATSYSAKSEPGEYEISPRDNFQTTLVVTGKSGCSNTVTKEFVIRKPTALFSIDTASGCIPLSVSFADISIAEDNIINKTWIFGDGNTEQTTNNTIYTYTNEGEYFASLVIETEQGCTDTSYAILIQTGKKLSPFFTINYNDACSNQLITLTDATDENNLIDNWFYSFGKYNVPSQPGESTINFELPADTGYLDGKLAVDYNGCLSDTVIDDMLHMNGPVADFDVSFDCSAPLDYTFQANLGDYTSFEWTLPDNSKNITDISVAYTFPDQNNYSIQLIVNNNSCSDTLTKTVDVRIPNANFTFTDGICSETEVTFTDSSSFDISNYCAEKFFWDFGDSSQSFASSNGTAIHNFENGGNYNVQMTALYDNGCFDTIIKQVRIFQPVANFSADTTLGCTPFTVVFSDLSASDIHSINNWSWNFGDGTPTDSYSVKQDTISHLFTLNGEFTVTLTVTDTFGCSNQYDMDIATANPVALFNTNNNHICLGDTIVFSNETLDIDSVLWDFGDGIFAKDTVVFTSHIYKNTGSYQVEMQVYKYGCSDTMLTDTNYIQIQKADASFTVNDTVWDCYPKEITFEHKGDSSVVSSGLWDFDYNNRTSEYAKDRSFVYPVPGTYETSLSINTSFGCKDSMSQNIVIKGPTGSFSISEDSACLYDEIVFTLNSDTSNLVDYEWDMGDGTFLIGNPINYTYSTPGIKIPTLILYGADESCTPTIEDTLFIYEVISQFIVSETEVCEGTEVSFTNTSTNNFVNQWKFGDTIVSSEANPVITLDPGINPIQLIVLNEIGCSDTSYHQVTVNANPTISMSNDTIICLGDIINISALGGDTASWSPATGLGNANNLITSASPEINTTYTATITNSETGCENSGTITIRVQPEPSVNISPSDTSIVIGEIIQVKTDTVANYTYQWVDKEGISCLDCLSPELQPLVPTEYMLQVTDSLHCFTINYPVMVDVREHYTVDLPTAFAPDSDEPNNILYVKGHGIAQLLEFRIFNRWGNEVFYTDDISVGWDGTFQNKPQPIGTYVYSVTIQRYDGGTETKKGTVDLIR